MPFTPIESTIGGLLIGLSSSAHLYLQGEISGMSGIASTAIRGLTIHKNQLFNTPKWIHSCLYLSGLLSGGVLLQYMTDSVRNTTTTTNTKMIEYILYCIAGLLVGIGTQLANGCTSGHMICGLARLSKRSLVAVMTFCSVAFLMVNIFGTINLVVTETPTESDMKVSFMTLPSFGYSVFLLFIVFIVGSIYFLIIKSNTAVEQQQQQQQKKKNNNKTTIQLLLLALQFFDGLVFALGLGLSGMVKPEKVLGFFAIFNNTDKFDPSLVCVAVGAILFDLIVFQMFILKRSRPLLAESFSLPTLDQIEWKLVSGAALFGIGWGLMGICPGPAIVNLSTLAPKFILFNVMFLGGILVKHTLLKN